MTGTASPRFAIKWLCAEGNRHITASLYYNSDDPLNCIHLVIGCKPPVITGNITVVIKELAELGGCQPITAENEDRIKTLIQKCHAKAPSVRRRICSFCHAFASQQQTPFKKCGLCKEEVRKDDDAAKVCYYCSPECQVGHWHKQHRAWHAALNSA